MKTHLVVLLCICFTNQCFMSDVLRPTTEQRDLDQQTVETSESFIATHKQHAVQFSNRWLYSLLCFNKQLRCLSYNYALYAQYIKISCSYITLHNIALFSPMTIYLLTFPHKSSSAPLLADISLQISQTLITLPNKVLHCTINQQQH